MKLRGGVWVSDNSDAEALAVEHKASRSAAPLRVEKPATRLLRNIRKQDRRATEDESQLQRLERTARFIKAAMQ